MTRRLLLLLVAATAFATNLNAQSRAEMLRLYPWVDTTGESGVYPIGDAVDVYRAALDLLYTDGTRRPAVIVVHDTAEPRGGEGPCPVACKQVWPHKSKIDTSTVLAFARLSPKRPRIQRFGYSVPLVFVSYADRERMRQEGLRYMAAHNLPFIENAMDARIGFVARYPGAWGLTQFTKVGFNTRHTQALVQVRHWCGERCASDEVLFLKRIGGRWRVIERIPSYAEVYLPQGQRNALPYPSRGNLQYRGPAGSSPNESEIVSGEKARPLARSEPMDAASVYRAVLDSLYHFQGDSARMIVLTDRFRNIDDTLPSPKTRLDSGLLQKYAFYRAIRTTPGPGFKYRLPVGFVTDDSVPRLEKIGGPIADQNVMNPAFWFGFRTVYPGAWGMVGFSRVAFNLPHTQALVYSNHQCGEYCGNGDTWVLERKGENWRVVERIQRSKASEWEPALFPLRYAGLDAKQNAYRHRHVYAQFINAVTNAPLSFLSVNAFQSGDGSDARVLTADSAGRVDIGTIPFAGIVGMKAGCPDPTYHEPLYVLEYLYSPGSDTTITSRIDFRECIHKAGSLPLTGAQAFISRTGARFTFPLRPASESWDPPIRRASPGNTEYWWRVEWDDTSTREAAPVALWLTATQKPDGPRAKSLAEVVAGNELEILRICRRCHDEGGLFSYRAIDPKGVSGKVVNGQIVFAIEGSKAVKDIFPVVPRVVTFATTVRHKPSGKIESEINQSQAVVVNCRPSDSTGQSRRRCGAPTNAQLATPRIDSTAPRSVKVVALSYDGASLMRDLEVRIRSEDRRDPVITKSTGRAGDFSILQPSRDSVSIEALCPGSSATRTVSGKLSLYLAAGRDTTLQLIVDPRRCSR